MADDSLNVNKMNVNPVSKQRVMLDGYWIFNLIMQLAYPKG